MKLGTSVVGIDLGTTNCTLALATAEGSVEIIAVPQLDEPGMLGRHEQFPSALYIPFEQEFPSESLRLPWGNSEEYLLGRFARDRGASAPDRVVLSAKSWLCNPHVDRREPILPWGSEIAERKVSPLDASAAYLSHLRHSMEAHLGEAVDWQAHEVVVTVPASFDEAARNLTVEAARRSGIAKVTLLEEPLAALYAWLAKKEESWREHLNVGDIICVCDVGGGTADFSLVAVSEQDGELSLERLSVGDHILLGGDNMDLAVAYFLKSKLEGQGHRLDNWQFQSLVYQARRVKERLFSGDEESLPLTLAGKGSSLFASTLQVEARRDEILPLVIEGFFPRTDYEDEPYRDEGGISEFGLSYEAEPALTKHLAAFLRQSAEQLRRTDSLPAAITAQAQQERVLPTAVLFNGGVFSSALLRTRILEVLTSWGAKSPLRELPGADVDLAVARGAAHYGWRRASGKGIRIRAGIPRSYYLGLKSAAPAVPGMRPSVKGVCVVAQGMEEGSESTLDEQKFALLTGREVEFRFFSSQQRPDDTVGTIVENAESELLESARLSVSLPAEGEAGSVPVQLHSVITEVGTLELWMQSIEGEARWKLEFDVRAEKKTPVTSEQRSASNF